MEVARETTALPDISTLATKVDIERLEQATKAEVAKLEAKISVAQFQSVGVIITAMAVIVTLGATLPKLLG